MSVLREKLWLKTGIGGMARYENNDYHRVTRELPGNTWFICTLWLADYPVEKNEDCGEIDQALEIPLEPVTTFSPYTREEDLIVRLYGQTCDAIPRHLQVLTKMIG